MLTKETEQILLSGYLGDGSFNKNGRNYTFSTNCKHQEYIYYKGSYLEKDVRIRIKTKLNKGFKITEITQLYTINHPRITGIAKMSLEEVLANLTEFGLALWIYDDGSLHKSKHFLNLNTHAFTKEDHERFIIPYFKKLGVKVTLALERKKDGREFYYCRINKRDGVEKLLEVLNKYPVPCYAYKTLSPETIEKVFQRKIT